MTRTSAGPWSYDAESGLVFTKDTRGDWTANKGPRGVTTVCSVESLDGIHNGPLIAAAPEMRDVMQMIADGRVMPSGHPFSHAEAIACYQKMARAVLAKLQDPVPAWQDDAYDATDRTAHMTDCASVPK